MIVHPRVIPRSFDRHAWISIRLHSDIFLVLGPGTYPVPLQLIVKVDTPRGGENVFLLLSFDCRRLDQRVHLHLKGPTPIERVPCLPPCVHLPDTTRHEDIIGTWRYRRSARPSRPLVSSPRAVVAACGGRYVFRNDSTRGVFERIPVT